MRSPFRRASTALVWSSLLSSLAACPVFEEQILDVEEVPLDAVCPAQQSVCRRNVDCAAGTLCIKEESAQAEDEGCCVAPVCTSDDACVDGERCALDVGTCLPVPACDLTDDASCGEDETCVLDADVARCVLDVDLPAIAQCHVSPRRVVLVEGAAHPFVVVQWDARGLPARAHRVPVVSSTTGAVTVDAASGKIAAAPCVDAPCEDVVLATVGDVQCAMEVVVVDPLSPGQGRVSVQDAHTGAPLVDASVAFVFDDAHITITTDARGLVLLDRPLDDVRAVTARAETHEWLTFVAPRESDLAFFVEETQADVRAVKGKADLSLVHTIGDIGIAYAGFAPRAALSDVELGALFGPLVVRTVAIEGVAEPTPIAFPLGQSLTLGVGALKSHFVAAPRVGESILTVFAGKVRVDDVASLVLSVDDGDEALLNDVMTSLLYERMNLSVVGDVPTAPVDPLTLVDADTNDAALPLPELEVRPEIAPTWRIDVDTPRLPCAEGAPDCTDDTRVDAALALIGVRVPGAGFVPTGMKAFFDRAEDEDGITDAPDGFIGTPLGTVGRVSVRGAPPPHGLADFAPSVVVATRAGGVLFPNGDAPLSAVRASIGDPSSSVGFSSLGYAPIAPVTRADDVVTFALEGAPIDAVKVRVVDDDGAAWTIYAARAATVDLSFLVEGAEPRVGAMTATAMRLRVESSPLPLDALFARSSWNLDRIEDATDAWTTSTVE